MSRVKIGILGCGAIAQVQHLPNLLELDEAYEVPIVCDLSPDQAKYVADCFRVPRHVSHVDDLLSADIDAVLLCHTDPKAKRPSQSSTPASTSSSKSPSAPRCRRRIR